MKLKLKVVRTPEPRRRLAVFRQICPDPPEVTHLLSRDLLDELDSILPILPTPTETNTQYTLNSSTLSQQTLTNGKNITGVVTAQPSEPMPSVNTENRNTSVTPDNNENVEIELSEAIRQLQVYRQTKKSNFIQQNGTYKTNYSPCYVPPGQVMNTKPVKYVSSQSNRNGEIVVEPLPPSVYLPSDLLDEINYMEAVSGRSTEKNQYCTSEAQMQFIPQQYIPIPTYSTNFSMPYIESGSMDTINLTQPNTDGQVNLYNGHSDQMQISAINSSQPVLQNHMNYSNEFVGQINAINGSQPILQNPINFANEYGGEMYINPVYFTQPPVENDMNFPNECAGDIYVNPIYLPQMNAINSSQPALHNPNEYVEKKHMNTINSQVALQNHMHFSNDYTEQLQMNSINSQIALQNQINFSNQYGDPTYMNTINSSQPVLLDQMNFYNQFPQQWQMNDTYLSQTTVVDPTNFLNQYSGAGPVSTVDLQPTLTGATNFSNGFSEPMTMNTINSSQPYVLYYDNNISNEYQEPTHSAMILPQSTLMNYMNLPQEFSSPYTTVNPVFNNISGDVLQGPGESYNIPRPILNRNNFNGFRVSDLSQNSNERQHITEDYTTDYSLTHPITRRTSNKNQNGESVTQNNVSMYNQPNFPLNPTNNYTETPAFTINIPRPILNRTYVDEPKPCRTQNPVDEFPAPYEGQNPIQEHVNSTLNHGNPYKYAPFLLHTPKPTSKKGIYEFPISTQDQPNLVASSELLPSYVPRNSNGAYPKPAKSYLPQTPMPEQRNFVTNYTNRYPEFVMPQNTPIPDFNHINGFAVPNASQNSRMYQNVVRHFYKNSKESEISKFSKLPQNGE